MPILIFAALVLVLLIIAIVIIEKAPFGEPWLKWALEAVVCLIAILAIAQRAGMF